MPIQWTEEYGEGGLTGAMAFSEDGSQPTVTWQGGSCPASVFVLEPPLMADPNQKPESEKAHTSQPFGPQRGRGKGQEHLRVLPDTVKLYDKNLKKATNIVHEFINLA